MPDLVFKIEEPDNSSREVVITAGMRIGRDPASDCPLNDQNVSSRHAVIVEKAGILMIEDVGSSNKTRVRGGPVLSKGDSHPLTPGLVLGMGKCSLTVGLKESPKAFPGTDKVAQTSSLDKTEAHAIHPYGDKAIQAKANTGSENATEAREAAKSEEALAPDSESKTSSKEAQKAAVKADKPAVEKAPEAKKEEVKKPEPKSAAKVEEKTPVAPRATTETAKKVEAAAPAAEAPAAPAAAEKPKAPAEPLAEKPVPVAKAAEAAKPVAPAEAVAAEKPAPAEKPAASPTVEPEAKPVAAEKPAAPAEPAVAEKPAPVAKPEAAKKEPAATVEKPAPAKPAEPAKAAAKAMPELPEMKKGTKEPKDYVINRYEIDLGTYSVKQKKVVCEDFEDVLGGVARAFKTLQTFDVHDAYDPKAPLIMNLGLLSGTQFMTGLRTFFHGYSPLKASHEDKPSAMWTAGSGKFGTKIRYLGIDEIIFTGRAVKPVYLHISMPEGSDKPKFSFKPADNLKGHHANQKIQHLYAKYPEAHFAVIGPAGENFEGVRFASIALSTINQLRSGDMKSRFCGRGGFGGVMGSKNLLGIVADVKDQEREKVDGLKELNMIVARGEGSRRFRDKKKGDGGGGTWANMAALDPIDAMPEFNFNPTGTKESLALWRDSVEAAGKFIVKDEACFACGIACHKNLYENEDGKRGAYRAKFDYEPLNLLSANIGIMDIDQAATLVELVDDLCMDSISIGVTLSYAMEYNRRMKEAGEPSILPDYVRYGDFAGTKRAIEEIGTGKLAVLGQGSKRLSEALGETDFAMHCKGVEFPAYMPHVNPGYPWALAGGHMSMRTYLLYVFEKEKSMDYWVNAITTRGPMIMRDDVLGVCKFSAMCDDHMAKALNAMTDLEISEDELKKVVMRTFLRGYRLEKKQGFDQRDYVMPGDALKPQAHMQLEHFNTPEFFAEMKEKVTERFEKMLSEEGL